MAVLPLHSNAERPSFAASQSLTEYLRRMVKCAQMDIDFTFTQMMELCVRPRKVYQFSSYRKNTKDQWARDDPAFIVVLVFFLLVAGVSYGIALQAGCFGTIHILCVFVGAHFGLAGVVIATISWFVANNHLRVRSASGLGQRLEWMYAFDIHCNSFFPYFIVLYLVHYLLLPVLVLPTTVATVAGNSLYAVAYGYYFYITSLGYSALPFLERTEVFLYPTGLVFVIVAILSVFGVNLTQLSVVALSP